MTCFYCYITQESLLRDWFTKQLEGIRKYEELWPKALSRKPSFLNYTNDKNNNISNNNNNNNNYKVVVVQP